MRVGRNQHAMLRYLARQEHGVDSNLVIHHVYDYGEWYLGRRSLAGLVDKRLVHEYREDGARKAIITTAGMDLLGMDRP